MEDDDEECLHDTLPNGKCLYCGEIISGDGPDYDETDIQRGVE